MIALVPRLLAAIRAPLASRRGVAAVEFALVAAPFVFILFAIIEIGLIFVANTSLANATLAIARQLRVGTIMAPGTSVTTSTGASMDLQDFKTAICAKMQLASATNCTTQLQVDVRTLTTYSNTVTSNPVANKNFSNSSLCYYSGSGGSIVELRTFYLWPISTPLLLTALVNATSYTAGGTTTSGNYYVLAASEVFVIEQNSSGSNTGNGC